MCEYEETREAWRVNAISYEVPHSLESLVAGGGAKVATLHRRGCVGCPEEGSRCRPFSRFFTKPSTHTHTAVCEANIFKMLILSGTKGELRNSCQVHAHTHLSYTQL